MKLLILGIFLILNALGFAIYWSAEVHTNKGWVIFLCLVCVFVGIFFTLHDRALEITFKGIGKIKAAEKQATTDAKAISDIKDKIENQEKITSDLRKAIEESAIQISEMLDEVRTVRSELQETQSKVAKLDKVSKQTQKTSSQPKLLYSTHSVDKLDDEIEVVLYFKSTSSLALGRIEFYIDMEEGSNSKILSVLPAEPVSLAVQSRISENKRKAQLSYITTSSSSPRIKIKLSAPGNLSIHGNPNLELFKLKIQ